MTEDVNRTALSRCTNVGSVSIADTLGYRDNYVRMTLKRILYVLKELVIIKVYLGKINVIGRVLAVKLTDS